MLIHGPQSLHYKFRDYPILTSSMLWEDSADDKLMIFFLFFLENRIWHFMLWRQFAWSIKSHFLGKIRKIFQNVVCWNFYPACKVLGVLIHLVNFLPFYKGGLLWPLVCFSACQASSKKGSKKHLDGWAVSNSLDHKDQVQILFEPEFN